MAGQRFPTPDEGDGTRIFYESIFADEPTSKFAEKWLMEFGCLAKEQAEAAAKRFKAK